MRVPVLGCLAALVAFVAGADPVRAGDPGGPAGVPVPHRLVDRVRAAGKVVNLAELAVEGLTVADGLTETKRTSFDGSAAVTRQTAVLCVEHRVGNYRAARVRANTVLGYEVPGRRVEVRIRCDVVVDVRVDPKEVAVSPDPDDNTRLLVTLRKPDLKAYYPPDAEAEFTIDTGYAVVPIAEDEKAAGLKAELYRELLGEVRGGVLADPVEVRKVAETFRPLPDRSLAGVNYRVVIGTDK
jgi:hypothetical protein